MSSISLGVAALVAIDSFSENVIQSVHEQSKALLGGDVSSSRQTARTPAIDSLLDSLSRVGFPSATATTFNSMALVQRTGGTRLVQVHAVSPAYPFYGNIITAPAEAWSQLQSAHNVIVDPSLLVSLDGRIGDTVSLGSAKFVVVGTLKSVPGDVGISAAIGPRVYIPERYVEETQLVVFGSRAEYETLFKLPSRFSSDLFIARYGKPASAGHTGRQHPRRRVQRVAPRQRDRGAARLSRDRRTRRAPARRHRRRERRPRVRDAEDRSGRGAPLPRRDELAGARDLHAASGDHGTHRRRRRASRSAS